MKVLAIDWSGARTAWSKKIWLAQAEHGRLVRLEGGWSCETLCDHLIGLVKEDAEFVVGLDFAFSAPTWFLQQNGLTEVGQLWDLAVTDGETWLGSRSSPFWGWT